MTKHYISRIGGKYYLANYISDQLIELLAENQYHYSEPFFGAGSVYFTLKGRAPSMYSYLGDVDAELMNFWKMAVTRNSEFNELTSSSLQDENIFEWMKTAPEEEFTDPLLKAFRFYYLARASMYGKGRVGAGTLKTGSKNQFSNPSRQDFLSLPKAMSKTILLNRDFEEVIKVAVHYDPNILIYCDPPYYGTEFYYKNSTFGDEDHLRLFEAIRDKNFLLSQVKCRYIEEQYADFRIEDVETPHMMHKSNRKQKEVLIYGNNTRV